jgi:hypothetical protein
VLRLTSNRGIWKAKLCSGNIQVSECARNTRLHFPDGGWNDTDGLAHVVYDKQTWSSHDLILCSCSPIVCYFHSATCWWQLPWMCESMKLKNPPCLKAMRWSSSQENIWHLQPYGICCAYTVVPSPRDFVADFTNAHAFFWQ